VIAYASRTGTRKSLASLRACGWRLMISAKGVLRTEGFAYALDNGAWTAHANGQPFDEVAFLVAFERLGAKADFAVVPDVVGGGAASLEFSLRWLDRLRPAPCPLLLAVQDGMAVADVASLVGPRLGIFVGGTTEWKVNSVAGWGRLAGTTGAYLHVGRVNTRKRIVLCTAAGADSFDGSAVSRWAIHLPLLDSARHQPDFFGGEA
jgi:hypothetical protein